MLSIVVFVIKPSGNEYGNKRHGFQYIAVDIKWNRCCRRHFPIDLAEKENYYICVLFPYMVVRVADWNPSMDSLSWMSRAGGRDVVIATCDCVVSMTSQTSNVCKHRFSATPVDKIS